MPTSMSEYDAVLMTGCVTWAYTAAIAAALSICLALESVTASRTLKAPSARSSQL